LLLTHDNIVRKALFQMLGVFAAFGRSIIQECITAGIARARANGTRSGKAFWSAERYPPSGRTLYGLPWRLEPAFERRRGTGNATVARIAAEMHAA
jgi:hypothetical protein